MNLGLTSVPSPALSASIPSPVARKSARRRNAAAIKAGCLVLVTGDAEAGVAYGPADLIVACHVLYFWADPVGELQRVREALAPAGQLALGYQLRQNMPPISQRAFPPLSRCGRRADWRLFRVALLWAGDDSLSVVVLVAGEVYEWWTPGSPGA